MRRFRRSNSGSALIEMALVMPVFFSLLFGLFDYSNVLLGYCTATYAARAAARYASLHSSTSLAPCTTAACVTNVVKPFIVSFLPRTLTVTTVWTPTPTIGSTVKVSVSVAYTMQVPFTPLSSVSVGSTAQRVILH